MRSYHCVLLLPTIVIVDGLDEAVTVTLMVAVAWAGEYVLCDKELRQCTLIHLHTNSNS